MTEKRPQLSKIQVDFARRELSRAVYDRKEAINKEFEKIKPQPPALTAHRIVDLINSEILTPSPEFSVKMTESGWCSSVYLADVFPNWRTLIETLAGVKEYGEAHREWKGRYIAAMTVLEAQHKLAEREIILGDVQEALKILRAFEQGQPIPVQRLD